MSMSDTSTVRVDIKSVDFQLMLHLVKDIVDGNANVMFAQLQKSKYERNSQGRKRCLELMGG